MTSAAVVEYPDIASARLPASYEAAKVALAECQRIDECADWANKMDALASYAKQSKNDDLEKMAMRIRARAIRRCGELLGEIEAAKTGPKLGGDAPTQLGRFASAKQAGLSRDQAVAALRVAAVADGEFEAAVASDTPPTITSLAERGKATRPKSLIDPQGREPEEFRAATQALGEFRDFVRFIREADQRTIVRGAFPHERTRLDAEAREIAAWLAVLCQELEAP